MNGLVNGFRRGIGGLLRAYGSLLLPTSCTFCQADILDTASDVQLCDKCLARLGPKQWLGCQRCGEPVAEDHLAADDCPKCRKIRLHFDAVVVLGNYHVGLSEAVLRMKRPAHDPLSLAMGRLLCETGFANSRPI